MYINSTGLVLEGGGMRGLYTAGVLEYFLENDIEFPYVIGVSAGACMAASYLSKQLGRNAKVNIGYANDRKYLSFRNLIKNGELFGMDYLFNKIPNELVPFDYKAFEDNPSEFVIGTTDCKTGEPVYFSRKEYQADVLTPIRASSSLPFMAPIVSFQGFDLLDGGLSDPVPLKKAEQDGFAKNVVILTRNRGHKKNPPRYLYWVKRKYSAYPGVVRTLENRWRIYNEMMDTIDHLEKQGRIFVIRPTELLKVSRIERNQTRLQELFDHGYESAHRLHESLIKWVREGEEK